MQKRSSMVLMAALVAVASMPAVAEAQMGQPKDGAEGKLRLGVFFHSGFGGEAKLEYEDGTDGTGDLDATVGFGALVDQPIIPYFAIGGLFRLSWLKAESAVNDRVTTMDLSVMPRGRYPFARGEVYLGLPIGLSLQWVPDTEVYVGNVPIGSVTFDTGVGWNVGLLFGGQFLVTENIGLFGHLGAQFRGTKQTGTGTIAGTSASQDLKIKTKQFVLEVGASFLL